MPSPWGWVAAHIGRITPGQAVAMFTFINILNYLDRGIVPGAFDSIGDFIRQDLQTENTDVQIGLLQSMYIVGYAVASVSFGHLVHRYPPFHLMSIGLGIWVFAVLLSGWAPHFWTLVLARVFSGVGEASFQTVVPPYIDDNAPPAKRGLWLSLFFSAIPVGTAVGYAWGGNVATALTWRWAFFLEAIPMIPLAFVVWFVPSKQHHLGQSQFVEGTGLRSSGVRSALTEELGLGSGPHGPGAGQGDFDSGLAVERTADGGLVVGVTPSRTSLPPRTPKLTPAERPWGGPGSSSQGPHTPQSRQTPAQSGIDVDAELAMALGNEEGDGLEGGANGNTTALPYDDASPSFVQELLNVLTEPVYMSIVLGYAGYTAVLAGMGSFGPTITKGLGLFNDQSTASLYFGAAVSLAGAIGTPLGGYLLDWGSRRQKKKAAAAAAAQAGGTAAAAAAVEAGISESEVRAAAAKLVLDSPGAANGAGAAAYALTSEDGQAPGQATALPPDDESSNDPAVADFKMNIALPQAVWATAFGTVACMGGIMLGKASGGLFFTLLGLGALALCTTTAGINQSIMAAVRPESRSFAIGLGTLLVHAFGDVPAPPIIGAIADKLSPQTCTGQDSALYSAPLTGPERALRSMGGMPAVLLARHAGMARRLAQALTVPAQVGPQPGEVLAGQAASTDASLAFAPADEHLWIDPMPKIDSSVFRDAQAQPHRDMLADCTRDAGGLQITLVITLAWLVWPVLLWGAAWVLVSRRMSARAKASASLAAGSGDQLSPVLNSRYLSQVGAGGEDGDRDGATALLSADRGLRINAPGRGSGVNGLRGGALDPQAAPAGLTPPRDWGGRVDSRASGGGFELRDM